MDTLGNILNRANQNRPILKQVRAALVVETANKYISAHLHSGAGAQAQAMYFKNNILTIACLSSVVSQEIRLREAELTKELNAKFGQNAVKKIRYLA